MSSPDQIAQASSKPQELDALQSLLASIADPKSRAAAELAYFLGRNAHLAAPKDQIVMLVHGIRTHAEWQERLRDKLAAVNIKAQPIGYGIFDAIRFVCPIGTRAAPRRKVERELRSLRMRYPDAEISVVAHSFGTYLIAQILEDATDIQLHRLLLCGSIIPPKYRWDKVQHRISGSILNDAGTKDIWPALARSTWGYGASGVLGFKTTGVEDRFHECAHSDFFKNEHMEKYWLPFLQTGQIVPASGDRPSPPGHISFFCRAPIKTLLLASLVIGTWAFW
ncbi:hypothetical protein [Achromobacter insuavis]|uniref:hypothetical protein n=1 Tax=Achromobacter insuavis TaxID=1287735 RepID=UPI001F13C0E4|nr:hypothetical protein [Achromobacter insuavis]